AERRLRRRNAREVHDAEPDEDVIAVEQTQRGKSLGEIVTGEEEHRRLPRRQEAAVRDGVPAAELGEAALRRVVLRPQHVEELWTHVWHEGEREEQPLACVERM